LPYQKPGDLGKADVEHTKQRHMSNIEIWQNAKLGRYDIFHGNKAGDTLEVGISSPNLEGPASVHARRASKVPEDARGARF
jgi:hypothetical protein